MTLAHALSALDLTSAVNRLCLHNDPVELALLTDEQFAVYVGTLDAETREIISQIVKRPMPGAAQ